MHHYSYNHSNPQSGIYTTLVALTLLAVLATIGLAVDTGSAYRTRLFLQNAVDAAAVKGTAHVLENMMSDVQIVRSSENLARLNMRINGYDPANVRAVSARIVAPRRGVHVDSTGRQPTWLLGLLPGFPRAVTLVVASEARSRTLSVVIVLDRSGSMNACMESMTSPCPDPAATRLWAAKTAAAAVVQGLQVGDQVGLVSFADNVTVHQTLTPPLTTANIAGHRATLLGLLDTASTGPIVASGATNTWSAVARGREVLYQGMNDPQHPTWSDSERNKVILFLSDGAPNSTIPSNRLSACDRTSTDPRMQMTSAYAADKPRLYQFTRAINEAIAAQQLGITINVVGIGQRDSYYDFGPGFTRPAPQLTVGRNPFQNVPDTNRAREPFMIHLANDQDKMWFPPSYSLPSPPPPPGAEAFWEFPCTVINPGLPTERLLTSSDRAAHARGRYAFATSVAELVAIFNDMVRTSRIRLTG